MPAPSAGMTAENEAGTESGDQKPLNNLHGISVPSVISVVNAASRR